MTKSGTNGAGLAPIALFAYKRPDEVRQVLEALQANHLAADSELYIFSDGPRSPADADKVEAVRAVLDTATGFRAVHRQYAETNNGLAKSIITNVTALLEKYRSVIVLEDDLLTSPNFLDYMNQCLQRYQGNPQVFSITGYSFPIDRPISYLADAYAFPRTGSWGWATWSDRWQQADWAVSDYTAFRADPVRQQQFNQGGSDRVRMLRRQQEGEINSWAIRWCYSQFKAGGFTIYPTESKIQNIGFSTESTNTNVFNRYRTRLDTGAQRTFMLPDNIEPTAYYTRQIQHQFSLRVRLFNRLKTYAGLRN